MTDANAATVASLPVDGRVEGVVDGRAVGWVWCPSSPEDRIVVAIAVDGSEVATSTADRFRKGLEAEGIGDGRHGFDVPLPASVADGGEHVIVVRAGAQAAELPRASSWTVRGSGDWEATRFAAPAEPGGSVLPEAPSVDGRLEAVVSGRVLGWARRSNDDERLSIRVLVDGSVAAEGVADLRRDDLVDAAVGDGEHAFSVALPAELADGGKHFLAVIAEQQVLPPSPGFAGQDDAEPWQGTRFVAVDPARVIVPSTRRLAAPRTDPSAPVDPVTDQDPAHAVVGGRGWLFPCDPGTADPDLLLCCPPAPAQLHALRARLARTAGALRTIGLRYVLAVVPAKVDVYRDLLPGAPSGAAMWRYAEALNESLRDDPYLDVLDLLPALRAARRDGEPFWRTGAGLSDRGALFAARALLKEAGKRVPGLAPVHLEDAQFMARAKPAAGDLARLPKAALVGDELVTVADAGDWREEVEDVDAATLVAQRMPAPDHLEVPGAGAPLLFELDDSERPRAALVGHPCALALVPWLAEHCRRLVVFQTASPPLEPLELEFPDLVLHVLDERLLRG